MVLENLISHNEGKTIDGIYISVNSNMLLFEPEWTDDLTRAISEPIKRLY